MNKHAKYVIILIFTVTYVLLPGCTGTTVTQSVTQTTTFTTSLPTTQTSTVTVTSPPSTITATSTPPVSTSVVTITPTGTYTSTAPPTGTVANGQRIFDTATSSSGQPIYSEGYMMMFRYVSCSDCHGEDGHGQTIYMMMFQIDVPNITWPELTSDTPPFTVDSLKLAITEGVDPAGGYLSFYMPRWQMSPGDLDDLASYIMTLT